MKRACVVWAAGLGALLGLARAEDTPAGKPMPGKPGAPNSPVAEGASAERPHIVRLSATRSRLGVIEFDHGTREITIPAEVNMVKGLLEYALVGEKGKLHEALLSTKARAFDLNVVLLLLSYAPDARWWVPPAKPRPLAEAQASAQLDARVRWQAEGRSQEARLDAWILDLTKRRPAAAAPWIYTGSYVTEEGRFAAEVDASLVALYLDTRAMINSPREGADNDEQWVPAPEVPPKGTAVTVVIRPAVVEKKPQ